MDINVILTAITTVGFPIVACLGLGFYVWLNGKAQREDHNEGLALMRQTYNKQIEGIIQENKVREERLHLQIDRFGESLNKFNETLTKIDARLGKIEKDVSDILN